MRRASCDFVHMKHAVREATETEETRGCSACGRRGWRVFTAGQSESRGSEFLPEVTMMESGWWQWSGRLHALWFMCQRSDWKYLSRGAFYSRHARNASELSRSWKTRRFWEASHGRLREDVMLTHRGTHKESWTSKKGHEVQRASKQSMTRNYKMYRCWSSNCIVITLPFQRKLFTRGETGSWGIVGTLSSAAQFFC